MAETTISWTATTLPDGRTLPGYSFNPWVGCQEVSPACDGCYARDFMTKKPRWATAWSGDRFRTSEANWRNPLTWNREAGRSGIRRKVFCASLADVFDNQILREWRDGLWELIERTPNLDWLLLTKRPQNIRKMLPAPGDPRIWGDGWPNVWLGTTVENQVEADRRIPHLLAIPARVHFLSCEPLLSGVDIRQWLRSQNGNQRSIDPGFSNSRDADDRRTRSSMATPGNYTRIEDRGAGGSVRTETRRHGTFGEGRLSPHPGHNRQGQDRRASAQDRVDGLQSENDPDRVRAEPQEWGEVRQLPRQFGIEDPSRERLACPSRPGPVQSEPQWKTDPTSSTRNSSIEGNKDDFQSGGSGSFQYQHGNGPQDRAARNVGMVGISWVIGGGESGPKARPTHPDWFRSLRDQCAEAGVPYFHKQNGEWLPTGDWYSDHPVSLPLRTYEGAEWTDNGHSEGEWLARIGVKKAGALLDGVEHKAMPL